MLIQTNLRDPTLINTIGHIAGLLLFGFIIILFLRDHRAQASANPSFRSLPPLSHWAGTSALE